MCVWVSWVKLCVCELCVCVSKLCVIELCVGKLCAGRREEEEKADGSAQPKTRTPYNHVGSYTNSQYVLFIIFLNVYA